MAIAKTEKEIVGENIRRLCELNGVSIRGLAGKLEMNRAYLHNILNGSANATFDMLQSIAGYLGVTVGELLIEPKRAAKVKR